MIKMTILFLLQRILTTNCINVELDAYLPMAPNRIIESLSTFYLHKLEKTVNNYLNAIYILPMAVQFPACLALFVSSYFGDSFGPTRIQYFLTYTWDEVISRKIPFFHQPDTDSTTVFDEIDLLALQLFFEAEIYRLRRT